MSCVNIRGCCIGGCAIILYYIILRRLSLPAVIAGQRKSALRKHFAEREADFACSDKTSFHSITQPFVFMGDAILLPDGTGLSGIKCAGTVSIREYHPPAGREARQSHYTAMNEKKQGKSDGSISLH